MLESGERVLVAVSGGPDSTALLLMLRERSIDLVAAHYDHALQPASADVAAHVARLCAGLDVPLITERRSAPLPKGSLQAAARELRYAFLSRTASEVGAKKVALAHTADDVVEGVVMHLMRGCGIAGLRGMPASNGIFVRPLLDTWRADIEAFLSERGVSALEDPANSNARFERVRVRREILPALERSSPGVKRRLHRVAAAASTLQSEVAAAAERALAQTPDRLATLRALPEPIAAECLRILYVQAGGAEPGLGRRHLEAMLALLSGRGRGGRGVDLPGGLRFRVVGSRAEVVQGVVPVMETTLEARPCAGCLAPGAVHLKPGLDLRLGRRRPGLRMHLRRGTRKLQDVFVDARVPREDRDGWPLVMAGDRLAWVPGVAVDADLVSRDGEPSLHVTVNRILAAGAQKCP